MASLDGYIFVFFSFLFSFLPFYYNIDFDGRILLIGKRVKITYSDVQFRQSTRYH